MNGGDIVDMESVTEEMEGDVELAIIEDVGECVAMACVGVRVPLKLNTVHHMCAIIRLAILNLWNSISAFQLKPFLKLLKNKVGSTE